MVEEREPLKEETQTTAMDLLPTIHMVDLVVVLVHTDQTTLQVEVAELTEILVVLLTIPQIIEVVLAVVVPVVQDYLETDHPL